MKMIIANLVIESMTCRIGKKNLRKVIGVFLFSIGCFCSLYSQCVGINTTSVAGNSKALLDVDANNVSGIKRGLLIPRLTTTERNALSSSSGSNTESLLIYNKTNQCFEAWNETTPGWVSFGCINCQLPNSVVATTATGVTCTSFTANWPAVASAIGYFLDISTSSTFSSFVTGYNNYSAGNTLSAVIGGLTPATTYYYRVRAINNCGTSSNLSYISVTLTGSASFFSCNPCRAISSYGTFTSTVTGVPLTWITSNLGASSAPTSENDNSLSASGCYFQFNRSKAYGYSGSISPAWTITSITEAGGWLLSNDPCYLQLGGTWRLPTETEMTGTVNDYNSGSGSIYQSTFNLGAYNCGIKFTKSAYIISSTGVRDATFTYYWTSSGEGGSGYSFINKPNVSETVNITKATGAAAKCVKP